MDDMKRQIIRNQVRWRNMQRLGVASIACLCGEKDPVCFHVMPKPEEIEGNHAVCGCANCVAKRNAPKDPKALAAKRTALRKAGVKILKCMCGEDNPFCLQADHIDGRKFSDAVRALCLNCHFKRTARQLTEHPGRDFDPSHPLSWVINRISSLRDAHQHQAALLEEVEFALVSFVGSNIDT